ncbi:hypothetical protein OKW26_008297 [Paraburkholderia sp. 32]
MMTLLDVVKLRTAYVDNAASVTEAYETVCITDHRGEQEDIFLQGEDATVFIEQARTVYNALEVVTNGRCIRVSSLRLHRKPLELK